MEEWQPSHWIWMPLVRNRWVVYEGAPDEALLWRDLDVYRFDEERAQTLFTHESHDWRTPWREFSNYLRQGKDYFSAASMVPGASRALFLYYGALQLAKAELLVDDPKAVLGKKLQHGLSVNPVDSQSIDDGAIELHQQGVFAELYHARVGTPLLGRLRVPIREILRRIPLIASETRRVLGEPVVTPVLHTVAVGGSAMRSMLALPYAQQTKPPGIAAVEKRFAEVPLPSNWDRMFRFDPQDRPLALRVFCTGDVEVQGAGEGWLGYDFERARQMTLAALRAELTPVVAGRVDGFVVPPIEVGGVSLALPADMCTYAASFYISSLVRYKPSALDHARQPRTRWLLDAFCDQAAVHLVHGAMDRMLPTTPVFRTPLN